MIKNMVQPPAFWVRAFLLPACNERASTAIMLIYRAVAAVISLIVIAIDAGIYDSIYNISTPKPGDGDKAPWIMYGTNIAMLLCFFYFVLALFLVFAPTRNFHDASAIDPPPKLAVAVYVLHTVAIVSMTTSIIIYGNVIRNSTTYRPSQEAGYIIIYILIVVNLLVSATPVPIEHLPITAIIFLSYFLMLFAFRSITGKIVYPHIESIGNVVVVIAIALLVHACIFLGIEIKTRIWKRFNCYLQLNEQENSARNSTPI